MARTPGESREPWVKIKVGLRRSDKVGALPSAAARWGWTCTLLEAKTQRRMGVFGSRRHLRDLLGAEGRYVPDFLAVGLLHEVPKVPAKGAPAPSPWCESGRCMRDYQDARPGELVVHDYRREQRDPTNADRQAGWRDRNKDADQGADGGLWDDHDPDPDGHADPPRNAPGNAPGNARDNAPRNARDNAPRNASGNGIGNADRNGLLTRAGNDGDSDSDGRDVVERATQSESPRAHGRRGPSAEGTDVRLTAEQHAAWAGFGPGWRGFRAAWLDRGFRLPPGGSPDDDDTSQRGLLWQVVDAWPDSVGRWVREVPRGASARQVIGHVLDRYHEQRADAGVEDPEWLEAKEEERRAAGRALAGIGAVLAAPGASADDAAAPAPLDLGDGGRS